MKATVAAKCAPLAKSVCAAPRAAKEQDKEMAPNNVESEMLSADAVPMCRVSFSCGMKAWIAAQMV